MDGSCTTSKCCCYTDEVTFSQATNNQLQITGKVTGVCNSLLNSAPDTQTMPSSFQTVLTWSGEEIRLQLGRDNSYVSFVNINHGMCSASGLRISCNAGHAVGVNLLLMALIPILTLAINI